MRSVKKKKIIRWLIAAKNYKEFESCKTYKLYNNTYFLFFLLFKYLIFKDACFLNYKLLIYKYNLNLYLNIKECRFYFIFFYLLIRCNLFDFITFLSDNSIRYNLKNCKYIFLFNKYIYLYIYILKYLSFFTVKFNKYNYYKNKKIILYNNFFLLKEFKLKVDSKSFFLYRKYLEFFRLFKYNEYLSNHKIFWKYPKLKYLLHIYIFNVIKFNKNYRVKIFLNFLNIYRLKNTQFLDFNKCKLNLKNNMYNVNCSIILIRSIKLSNFLYLKLDNNFLNLKCINSDFFKFFDITANIIFYKLFKPLSILFSLYVAFTTFKVHHIFILRYKPIRRLRFRHILSLHLRFNIIRYSFLPKIFKIFYKYYIYNIFRQPNFINYGFLSYYFLENNNFIKDFIKKHLLLYRITNIIIIESISIYFEYMHWDLAREAHKVKTIQHTDLLKLWHKNLNSYKENQLSLGIVPLNQNITEYGDYILHSSSQFKRLAKDQILLNYLFIFIWNLIYKWSIVIYIDILNITRSTQGFLNIYSNFKYSFEFISWEILNSNNNKYILNRYILKFNYLLKHIKIENLINLFLSKYTNTIVHYTKKYPKDFFMNISFVYFFSRDFFFRILSKKGKINNIKFILQQNKIIVNNFNNFYFRFFNWQVQNFISLQRFWLFYFRYKNYYQDYVFYRCLYG